MAPKHASRATQVQNLASFLALMGDEIRLRIVAILSLKDSTASELAYDLGRTIKDVEDHLSALERAGLIFHEKVGARVVEKIGVAQTPVYHGNREALAEATAQYLALLGPGTMTAHGPARHVGDLAVEVVGPPPSACVHCQNSSYVFNVLDEVNNLLSEARQTQADLRTLSSQVLSAQEDERKRIARDLHDDTAQALTALLVRLRLLERLDAPVEVRESLTQLRELTAETLEGVRRLSTNLRPSALDDLGLAAALRWYVSQFTHRWSIPVELEASDDEERLPQEVELVLYRVIQEALTNVAKHAHAKRVRVKLDRGGDMVNAVVEDDGSGFNVGDVKSSKRQGLGLFGMEERLALVGGALTISTSEGQGTRLEARINLAPQLAGGLGPSDI